METAAPWGPPCEFQLASWCSSGEEPGAHSWAPADLPLPPVVEYAPTDIFGNSSLQPYFHSSSSIGPPQLAMYNYNYGAAAQTQHGGNQNAEPSLMMMQCLFSRTSHTHSSMRPY